MMHYRIGQTMPLEGTSRREVCDPGTPTWHGLVVPPQAEERAEAWLKLRGVYAFHPVKRRPVTIRGKVIQRESRYLPGYVFARFPGRIIWHRVHASPFISDAIRMSDGRVAELRGGDLRGIHAMRRIDETAHRKSMEARRAEMARRRAAQSFAAGDRVVMTEGPLAGQETEVVELRHGRAVLRLTLFGGSAPMEVDPAIIAKVDGGGDAC